MKSVLICISVFLVMAAVSLEAASITYTDKMGMVMNIPVPVKRAVLLVTPEMIPALNIWDKVVGINRWTYINDDLFGSVKPDWRDTFIPISNGADVNIEALLKLKPDIVITWSIYPETVRFMEGKGLRVIAIHPESLPEFYEVIRLHGRLFGREREAEKTIREMGKMYKLIQERVSGIPADKMKKVLLLFGPTSVACKGSLSDDIFKRVHAINPASVISQSGIGSAVVSMERIMAWDPDVIFIWGRVEYKVQDILNNSQWKHIKAVREGKVYKGPGKWSTWSPHLAPIALWMAMKIYPENFRDINFDMVAVAFYEKVFGIPYDKLKN